MPNSFKFISISILILFCLFGSHQLKSEIISDTTILNIRNEKVAFIRYDFERKMKVVIANEEELKYFSSIDIPFLYDPTRIYHNSKVKNQGNFYSSVKIEYFNVTQNGVDNNALYNSKMLEHTSLQLNSGGKELMRLHYDVNNISVGSAMMGRYRNYLYSTDAISIGDTLEFDIRYFVPLADNMKTMQNFRAFLNDVIPKTHCTFVLKHLKILNLNIDYANINPPVITEDKNSRTYIWNASDVKGCINEVNSKAYMELPYILISPIPEDFTYQLQKSHDWIPYQLNAYLAMAREYNYLEVRRSIKIGVINKNYNGLYKYIKHFQDSIKNDSNELAVISAIHNDINANFDYLNSIQNYKSKTPQLYQFWKMARDKEMTDRARIPFYMGLIGRINSDFYTGYLVDKRSGVIDEKYMSPMLTDDFCLVPMLKDNSLNTIWPKLDGITLHVNELPFFYEGTNIALFHPGDYLFNNQELTHELRSTKTPSSKLNHNQRSHTTLINVNLDSNIANAHAKILLSGQFSTLTRNQYKGISSFKSINPIYSHTIKDTWGGSDLKLSIPKLNTEFPYISKVEMEGNLSHRINNNDSIISISTSGFINHVITETTENRYTDYYFDFLGSDSYTYILKFNEPVVLDNPKNITLAYNEVQYVFEVSQVSDDVVRLVSKHIVLEDKIAAENYGQLSEIFNEMNKNNNFIIRLKPKQL